MICRSHLILLAAVPLLSFGSTPAFAGCADVLTSIEGNVSAFDQKRAKLLEATITLDEMAQNQDDISDAERDARVAQEELVFSLRETVVLLAGKIEEHSAMLGEECIPDE